VRRADSHGTNGRVKHNDVYAQIKAANRKYCPEFEQKQKGGKLSSERDVLQEIWIIFGGDIADRRS